MESSDCHSVLVVMAHPDDVDFGLSGTVAVWTGEGVDVSYLIVTNGEAGGSDRSISRSAMAEIRQREQRAAAAQVGVERVEFLGYPDGQLTASLALRRDISRVIRKVRPDRMVCQSAERNYRRIYASHPDHLAAGEAAMCAVYPDARNPFAFPELLAEGLEPHSVGEIWVAAGPHGDEVVDITDVIDQKVAALAAHESQIEDVEAIADRLRFFAAEVAHNHGLAAGRLAEEFTVVTIPG